MNVVGNNQKSFNSALGGFAFGSLVYAASVTGVMAVVPRQSEGVRDVVALSWPLYASLPCLIAGLVLIVLLLVPLPNSISRLAFIVAVGIAVAISALLSFDLLRRDFIGKL